MTKNKLGKECYQIKYGNKELQGVEGRSAGRKRAQDGDVSIGWKSMTGGALCRRPGTRGSRSFSGETMELTSEEQKLEPITDILRSD